MLTEHICRHGAVANLGHMIQPDSPDYALLRHTIRSLVWHLLTQWEHGSSWPRSKIGLRTSLEPVPELHKDFKFCGRLGTGDKYIYMDTVNYQLWRIKRIEKIKWLVLTWGFWRLWRIKRIKRIKCVVLTLGFWGLWRIKRIKRIKGIKRIKWFNPFNPFNPPKPLED